MGAKQLTNKKKKKNIQSMHLAKGLDGAVLLTSE